MANGVEAAIKAAGGATALAKKLKVTHQAVYNWKRNGWVPLDRALAIEKRFKISRKKLVSPKLAKL